MKHLFTLLFILTAASVLAQESEAIITDRPTQSASSMVMPKGNVLIEYGFISQKAGDVTTTTIANILARVGILKGVELRVIQDYVQLKDDSDNTDVNGLSPITLGTKVHLKEENGAFPQTSIIGQVTLRSGDEPFKPLESIPEVRLNFSNTLSDRLSLGYNLGMAFPSDNTQTIYTVVLGYSLAPGWTVFAEPYGFLESGDSDHRFNTGVIYLLKDNFQLDLTGGFGLSDIAPDHFIGFGAAIGF